MVIQFETVLAFVIVFIALSLLPIGIYIVLILRDVRKTVKKAGSIIDDVDKTVKDGIEKANAMELPLQALAATTAALTGFFKGTDILKRATQSILSGGEVDKGAVNLDSEKGKLLDRKKFRRPKFFKRKSK